jgi:hypothetical protein
MIAIGTTTSSMRQTYYDAESCRVKGSLGTLDRSSGCSAARVVRALGAGAGTTKTANGLTLSVVVAAMAIFAGVVGLGSSRMYVADRHARSSLEGRCALGVRTHGCVSSAATVCPRAVHALALGSKRQRRADARIPKQSGAVSVSGWRRPGARALPPPGARVVPRDNGVIYGIKSWTPARRDESFGLLTTCQRRARRRPLSVLGGV